MHDRQSFLSNVSIWEFDGITFTTVPDSERVGGTHGSRHWDNVRTAQPLLLLLTRHCQKLILNRIRLKPRPHCSGNPGRRRLRYSQQYKDSPQFQFPSLHNNSQRNTTIIPHQGTTYSHKMFKNSEPRQSSTSSDKSPRFPQIKGPNPLKSAAVYVPDPRHLFFPIGTTFCLY